MDITLARRLRYMSLLESAKAIHDSGALDPEDPQARLEHVRLLRDAGDFTQALAVLGPAGEGESPAMVAERVSALSRRGAPGDEEQARHIVETARRGLFDRGPDARYLVVAVARWRAGHGRVRDGLRLLHEYAASVTSHEHPLEDSATLFATRTLLLLRLGWHPAIRRAIGEAREHGFLDLDPGSDYDGARAHGTVRRLVTAGRMSARIGDVSNAELLLRRAEDVAATVHRHEGFRLPAPRRWRAHILLGNGRPHEALRLLGGDTDVETVTDLSCPIEANPMVLLEKALVLASRYDGTDTLPLDQALDRLDEAERAGGLCPELRWTRCRLLRRKGAHELDFGTIDNAALDRLGDIAANPAADAFAKLEYGQSLIDRGEHDRADEEFARILTGNTHHREVLLAQAVNVAEALTPHDDRRRLDEVTDQLCGRLVDDASILAIAAERFAQRGHYEQAERIFAHTNTHNPAHGLSWAGRIRAAAWQRDFTATAAVIDQQRRAGARQATDRLDIDEPAEIPQVRLNLAIGMVHADQQRYDLAETQFDRAREHWTADRDSYGGGLEDVGALVAVWLATGLRWRAAFDKAIALLEAARREYPHAAALVEELGWAHLEIHRPGIALSYFDKAWDMEPERSGAWRGRIQSLRQARRYDEGIAVARRARRVLPRDANILCELAWLYGERSRPGDALKVLDDAVRVDPTSPHALAWRVTFLTRQRRHAEAIAAGEQARRVRPESTEILDALCYAQLRAGRPDAARQLVAESMARADPDLALRMLAASVFAQAGAPQDQWRPLARALTELTDIPQAVRTGLSLYRFHCDLTAAEQALAACPAATVESDAGLRWERVELAVLRHDFAAAEADIVAARLRFPHSRSMVRRQAMLYALQERYDEAISLLRREIEHREVDWDLKATLAEILVEAGQPEPALELCAGFGPDKPVRIAVVEVRAVRSAHGVGKGLELAAGIHERYPHSRRVNLALARALEDFHRGPEGLALLRDRVNELPLFPPILEQLSLLHRLGKRFEAAAEVIESGLASFSPRDSAGPGLLAEQGWIATDAQDYDQAARLFTRLRDRGDVHAQALGNTGLGWVWLALNRLDRADEHFDAAQLLGIRSSDARYGKLVTSLRRSESLARDSSERERILSEAAAVADQLLAGPHSERTHTIAGHIAFQARRYDRARIHFENSIEHHTVQGAYASLGLVLVRLGRIDDALDVLETGLEHNPDRHAVLAALGTAHLHGYHDGTSTRADRDAGLSHIKRALELEPSDAVAVRGFALAALHGDEDLTDATELLEQALAAPRHRFGDAVRSNLSLTLADVLTHRAAEEDNPRPLLSRAARHAGNAHRWDPGPETAKAKRVVAELRAWRSSSGDPLADLRTSLRWQRWFGLGISTVSIMVGITFVAAFLLGHPGLGRASWYGMAVLVALCLVGALGGATITTLTKVKGLGIEMNTEPMAGSVRLESLPTNDVRPPPTVMVAARQAPGTWFSHPRFPRLGPAIGPLVTGYYANRDAYYPWRTR